MARSEFLFIKKLWELNVKLRKKRSYATSISVKKRPFASGVGFYKLFWVFFIGCIVGVIVETLSCLVFAGHFEVRWGVIYGPFNPVYGFGAVVITVILNKISKIGDLWIFLMCMVVGGLYEYLCSLVQEMAFGTVSWDYKNTMLNLQGRTNLFYSICWGVLGLVWLRYIYPRLSAAIEKIPRKFGQAATWILLVFMVLNMAISALAIWRQSGRNEGIPPSNAIMQFLDDNYPDDLLKKVYPNMRVVK